MKKSITVCLFVFLSFINMLFVQETPKNHRSEATGGGGFTIGYGNMDISRFREFLPANSGKFKNDFVIIGGTGHAYH